MKKATHSSEKEIPVSQSLHSRPTPEELREAAYYRWLERGTPLGDDWSDWYDAESRWREQIASHRND